jgi:predicted Zn finger-like uncharacterized protein
MMTINLKVSSLLLMILQPTVLAFIIVPISESSVGLVHRTQTTISEQHKKITKLFASDVTKSQDAGTDTEFYVKCSKCQTVYGIQESDLRNGGRRLQCSVCEHSWYQTKDRLLQVQEDYVLEPLPERDMIRIQRNIEEGKSPRYLGDKKLYVGNISFECHEEDLYKIFSTCGDVGDVSFVRDENGLSRGFGFVTMRTEADGLLAVDKLDGMEVRGRNIAVRESNN